MGKLNWNLVAWTHFAKVILYIKPMRLGNFNNISRDF